MGPDGDRLDDEALRRYLAARAEAAARAATSTDVVTHRVAVRLGLVTPLRTRRAWLIRIAVVATLLAMLALALGVGTQPDPEPTPTPTTSASPRPSAPEPTPIEITGTVPLAATAIEATADAVWVLTTDGLLAELDPVSGDVLRSVELQPANGDLLVTVDAVWIASFTADLLRVDLATLTPTTLPGVRGGALSEGPDGIWLGTDAGVTRIDPETSAANLVVPIGNRDASLAVTAEAASVWVATQAEVFRLDAGDGSVTGRVTGDASRLVVAEGSLWATRGTELVRIDLETSSAVTFIPGLPGAGTLIAADGRLWIAGPAGGGPSGTVVAIGAESEVIELQGTLPTSVIDLAIGAGGVWVAGEDGSIYRFGNP